MLSIEDIKNVSFRRANFGGYKPEDVDAFIDDIQISYEEMTRENENLKLMVAKLNKKIDKFYEEDNSIRNVILNAQKIAEKALEDTKSKTNDIMNKATEASKEMINNAKKEVSFHTEISDRLKSESVNLKKQLEDIYKKHMEIIDKIPIGATIAKKEDVSDSEHAHSDDVEEKKFQLDHRPEPTAPESETDVFSEASEEKVSGGRVESDSKDIFSSAEGEPSHHKFKNLMFGKDYRNEDDNKPKGVYSGIFRDKQ